MSSPIKISELFKGTDPAPHPDALGEFHNPYDPLGGHIFMIGPHIDIGEDDDE